MLINQRICSHKLATYASSSTVEEQLPGTFQLAQRGC